MGNRIALISTGEAQPSRSSREERVSFRPSGTMLSKEQYCPLCCPSACRLPQISSGNSYQGKDMDSSVDAMAGSNATAPEKRTSVRWKIFFLMLCLVSINYIDRASLSIAMPLISREFNLNAMEQGLILSSFFWTYTIMQVPGGMLADRFKPRIMIAVATFGWGFFQAIAAVSTGWLTLTL